MTATPHFCFPGSKPSSTDIPELVIDDFAGYDYIAVTQKA